MRCSQCQQENPPGSRFCNACGGRLVLVCPSCQHPNQPANRFCNGCGQELGATPATSPGASPDRFTSPRTYTPQHLAERILTSRGALEGERKQVTVLFADLKGSLELLADRDPEEGRKLLDPVLDRMMEAVHRYEGTVNQVMGDGIMALFGAPLAHEDHAVRACFAALRMQASVTRYGDEVQRSQGVPLQIRVGLHSGDVVVRSIGSDLHMDYTAVGQTTHLAGRMEQMAKPGSILVTAETRKLARGYVRVTALGSIPIRGLAAPVEVFELTGARYAPATLRTRTGSLSPFVGRGEEIRRLEQALQQTSGGRGQAVAVVGEPGVGKTRLFFELTRAPAAEGWLRLEASAASYGVNTPYFALTALLRSYFDVEEGEPPDIAREKVTSRMFALDDRLADAVPAVLSLLEVLPDGHPMRSLDSGRRRSAVQDAARRLLFREAQRQPVLLIVENLQWLDPDSRTLLERLMDALPSVRLLLLVNFRPEFEHAWSNRSYYTQLRLDPLGAPGADELLAALVGADPGLAPLKSLLVRRTEGNPLFLEESVRALAETGGLEGRRGAYRLAGALHAVQVPATIQALLAARIDRLAPDDKRVLQAASVIGTDVPFPVLQAIADVPDEELRRGLARLQAVELLAEGTLFPELAYTFRHALIHEVAYGSLLQEQRRGLHARIVTAIETLYRDRLAEWRDRLAHHVARGEVWHKSLAYFRTTAGPDNPVLEGSPWWAGDYEAALKRAELELVIFDDFSNLGLQVASRLRQGQVYHARGEYRQAVKYLRRGLQALGGDLEREHFDLPAVASVLLRVWLALCLAETGEIDEADAVARQALATAEGADDSCGRILASAALGLVCLTRDDLAGAAAVLEAGLVLARSEAHTSLIPFVAAPLSRVRALADRPEEALALLTETDERAEATKMAAGLARRLAWRAEADLLAGRYQAAGAAAERALAVARERGEGGNQARALWVLAQVAQSQGDLSRAEADFGRARELALELGMRPLAVWCRLGLGALYRRLGRPEEAHAELAAAHELCTALGMSSARSRAESELRALALG
jgi:predicted ATPase/class 3 adenylate cyclase